MRTFLRSSHHIHCFGRQDHERCWKLVAKEPELNHPSETERRQGTGSQEIGVPTYMNRIVFLKGVRFISLPHEDDNRSHSAKYSISRALVGLPCCVKAGEAIEKCVFINHNFLSHGVAASRDIRLRQEQEERREKSVEHNVRCSTEGLLRIRVGKALEARRRQPESRVSGGKSKGEEACSF